MSAAACSVGWQNICITFSHFQNICITLGHIPSIYFHLPSFFPYVLSKQLKFYSLGKYHSQWHQRVGPGGQLDICNIFSHFHWLCHHPARATVGSEERKTWQTTFVKNFSLPPVCTFCQRNLCKRGSHPVLTNNICIGWDICPLSTKWTCTAGPAVCYPKCKKSKV